MGEKEKIWTNKWVKKDKYMKARSREDTDKMKNDYSLIRMIDHKKCPYIKILYHFGQERIGGFITLSQRIFSKKQKGSMEHQFFR